MMQKHFSGLVKRVYTIANSNIFRAAILLVFALQAVFLAFSMNIGTPPDEYNHIEFIHYYADHSLSPTFENQTPTWSLGDKTREVDFLYHYLNSLVARAIPDETLELYIMRLLTVVMATATFFYLIKLFERLGASKAAANAAVAVLTNIPMVLMLSAAINNDVTVWFCSVVGTYLILNIWKRFSVPDIVLLLTFITAGGLLKRTFFPIALVLFAALVFFVVSRWSKFVASLKQINWQGVVLAVLLVVSLGLFIERVGKNIVQYGAVSPSCQRVQGEEACKVRWQAKRDEWIAAGAPAATNVWLPKSATQDKEPMSLFVFIGRWVWVSMLNIVDIQSQGWRHKVMPPLWLVIVLPLLMVVPLIIGVTKDIRTITRSRIAKQRLFVLLVALATVAAQLLVNYGLYLENRIFGLALNGRYLLPAILLLAGLSSIYIASLVGKRIGIVIGIAAVIVTVVFSGLNMMVKNPQLFTG